MQLVTDDKIYFYIFDKEKYVAELENVMTNFMACSHLHMSKNFSTSCIAFKTNQKVIRNDSKCSSGMLTPRFYLLQVWSMLNRSIKGAGAGPFGSGPIWAHSGPRPFRAQALFGPRARLDPGPVWAQGSTGPGVCLGRARLCRVGAAAPEVSHF